MDVRYLLRRGTTMMELLVSMSVMFLIFAGVAMVLFKGMAYLRSNESAMDAQRGAMLTLNKVSREVERTNMRFLCGQNGGLSFADPFGGREDPALHITTGFYSDTSGSLLWQRYICYYMNNVTHTLNRREAPYTIFRPALTYPPPAGGDVAQTPGTAPLDAGWWALQSTIPNNLIASDVAAFNVTTRDIFDNSTPPQKINSIVNVTLEMGDPLKNDYNHFWFRVQTQFSPRNSD